jgi:hypothetical protein
METTRARAVREKALALGLKGWDMRQLVDAVLEHCEIIVTNDLHDMVRRGRAEAIQGSLGVRVLTPPQLLEELRHLAKRS